MTFDNSSGLNFTSSPPTNPTPLLELAFDFGGSPGAPRVYSYKFEFTEADATALNLPNLSESKSLTCYMTPAITEISNIDSSMDLTSQVFLSEQTSTFGPPTNNGNNIGGTDTSGAMELV